MTLFIKECLVAIVTFLLIDMVWLVLIARSLYQKELGFIMSPTVNWGAALVFYAIYICGLVFFVVQPAMAQQSIQYAILAGAFFGLVCYATYDLTNLATLKDWPILITGIDLVWGASVSALTSAVTVWVATKFFT